MWAVKHKSGTVLFTTKDKFIALNRAQYGWRVEEMSEMNVYLSRPGARIPTYATSGSACFDIYAVLDEPVPVRNGEPVIIPTGLKFDIPAGYALMIYSRSGHGFNSDVRLSNCTGVIDSDYTGELMVKLTQDVDHHEGVFWVNHGDRIAQGMLIPVEQVTFKQINEPPQQKTDRQGGFGSTGS
nr:MAG TPA: deoxyuridine 5'-triphosphate nucleotidohydrolase [Caudoviricetes sp.]